MRKATLGITIGLLGVAVQAGIACTTPVYEYALMRWSADLYDVAIVHSAPLTEAAEKTGQALADSSQDMEQPANLMVRALDVSTETNAQVKALYEGLDLPALVVHYPHWPEEPARIAWAGQASEAEAKRVINSPVRRRLADELVKGNLPWIFLESGNAREDGEVFKMLKTELDALAGQWNDSLKELTPAEQPGSGLRGLSFPVLRLSRDDPAEALLVNLLMKSEPDLEEYKDKPIAFPCFGRGRVLFAFPTEGINKTSILEVVGFLTSPCACQVKVQNPGSDLLVAADWSRCMAIFTNLDEPEPPPDLIGVTPVLEPDEPASEPTPAVPVDPMANTALFGKALIVLAAVAVGMALVGLLVLKWKS